MAASMNDYSNENSKHAQPGTVAALVRSPVFNFTDFFRGHTRVSGWFSDPFGNPRRHFCGDFYGQNENGCFVLDEKLFYTDGVVETRVWKIRINDAGVFTAESDSLIGDAQGLLGGNTLFMRYAMEVQIADDKAWKLDMKDTMILQPDGSLHNITKVYKWGIRIGTVSSQYQHHDGSMLCESGMSNLNPVMPN